MEEANHERPLPLLLVVATLAGVLACIIPTFGNADETSTPIFLTKIPTGYRDRRLVSVAHEEGNLHSLAAILGNDVVIKAYRDATLPYPDGSIIAASHYGHVPSEANDKVFGDQQSFVPGPRRTFSLWSRIRKSTRQRADGASGTSARMADRAPTRCSKLAHLATRWLLAILCSRVTHRDPACFEEEVHHSPERRSRMRSAIWSTEVSSLSWLISRSSATLRSPRRLATSRERVRFAVSSFSISSMS